MKIDLDHLHHWMQAIRQSNNPMRTLDAFWSGQMKSKEWLIDCLDEFIPQPVTVDVHGGWVGVLPSMLFQSNIPIASIQSIDIDPTNQHVATLMNQMEAHEGRFSAITKDMCNFHSYADVIINTSCEHIAQEQYDKWLSNLPVTSLIVLQSTDYKMDEHVRPATSLFEFIKQSNLKVKWSGELELPLYKRFMIIGYKLD
jgi:hypothetical protein